MSGNVQPCYKTQPLTKPPLNKNQYETDVSTTMLSSLVDKGMAPLCISDWDDQNSLSAVHPPRVMHQCKVETLYGDDWSAIVWHINTWHKCKLHTHTAPRCQKHLAIQLDNGAQGTGPGEGFQKNVSRNIVRWCMRKAQI